MRVVVLYHPLSDHGGIVADYATEFESYKRKKLEQVSLETIEGADLAELYGVTQYPAVLAMSDNGSLIRLWEGLPMPLMDELSYYTEEPKSSVGRVGRIIITPSHA